MEKVQMVAVGGRVVGVVGQDQVALVGQDGEATTVPIVQVQWADERQWCSRVHEYLASGQIPDGPCPMHKDGICQLTGDKPCLLDEPEDSEGWAKARRWLRYRTPDGKRVLVARDDVEGRQQLEVQGFLLGADVQLPIAVVKGEAAQATG